MIDGCAKNNKVIGVLYGKYTEAEMEMKKDTSVLLNCSKTSFSIKDGGNGFWKRGKAPMENTLHFLQL